MAFGYVDAVIWSMGAFLALQCVVVVLIGAVPQANDLISAATCQVLVYVLIAAWFSYRRQAQSFAELFAFRKTSWLLVVLGSLLGIAMWPVADSLLNLVLKWAPLPKEATEELSRQVAPHGKLQGVLLMSFAAGFGPFVEELLFRGGLYTALRPHKPAAGSLVVIALCFTLTHPIWQVWPAIMVLACLIGALRTMSGSLWPGLAMHASYNFLALLPSFLHPENEPAIPLKYVLIGWGASVPLVLIFYWLAKRSTSAAEARAMDLVPRAVTGGEA